MPQYQSLVAIGLVLTLPAADLPKGFPPPRVPATNPQTEAKVTLGRYLFYDTRLSGNNTQSCATCHKQELAFTDGRPTALGSTGQSHTRGAMTLVNVAWSATLTWNNPSLKTLEEQALIPLQGDHPVELGLHDLTPLRADAIYQKAFREAFPADKNPISIPNVAKALASFERSIISARSPYDRYYRGGEPYAISEAAKRGEVLFYTDPTAGCYRCHGGVNFASPEFHNTAVSPTDPAKFKVPTLRNIALTAPYMHDGSIATLEDVLDHYSKGGSSNPHKDPRMTGFPLTPQNRSDLLDFLRSLTDVELTRDPRFSNPWGDNVAR